MTKQSLYTTCTRDCPSACGLAATVEDGRLVRLAGAPEHPLTRGLACRKASRYVQRAYHPERVTRPMIRTGGKGGGWKLASWESALDLCAEKLTRIRAESGTQAVLHYQGFGERTALKLLNSYFFALYGGATGLRGTLCGGTGQASQNLDYGERVSHDPLDHLNSASVILWGRNPASTQVGLLPILKDVRSRGGRVILVDPLRTRSAPLADRHIAPRPGGDGFLALAAARLVLQSGQEDREFLANCAEGLDGYLELVRRWSVDELCELAGVRLDDAAFLAETLTVRRPASILLGWGLHRHVAAHQTIRAIDALGAVSGNIGIPGGGVSQGFEEYGPYDQRWWGHELTPNRRTLLMPRVGREILEADAATSGPPIRMIWVNAANPACTAPRSDLVAEAFGSRECVVYCGHFLDDTARLADVFLPATTFLEETDVTASYGHNYIGPVNPVIAPVGECRSEFRMFHDLAGRFEFADAFQRSEMEWLEAICAPTLEQGVTMAELMRGPVRLNAPMVPFADRRFPTPSGRFRLVQDFDPGLLPATDPDYPFRLLTVAAHRFICSERTMADHDPLPEVRCNPARAAELGLTDGGAVLVTSPSGEAPARLVTDPSLRPDVLAAERGGWTRAGHDLNRLVADAVSAVGNGAPYYEAGANLVRSRDGAARPILVVQHGPGSPGGVFLQRLAQHGRPLDVRRMFVGEALPQSHQGFSALVALGGPQHAWDDADWPHFGPLMELMRGFDAAGKPVAGLCLGCQLLARAWGGRGWTMPELEFGFVDVAPTNAGRADPVLGPWIAEKGGLPRLMEFHQDSFDLPESATLLAGSAQCACQAFRVGRASYGFQFHMEVDAVTVADWSLALREGSVPTYREYRDQFPPEYFETLAAELPLLTDASGDFCRSVVDRWLALGNRGGARGPAD